MNCNKSFQFLDLIWIEPPTFTHWHTYTYTHRIRIICLAVEASYGCWRSLRPYPVQREHSKSLPAGLRVRQWYLLDFISQYDITPKGWFGQSKFWLTIWLHLSYCSHSGWVVTVYRHMYLNIHTHRNIYIYIIYITRELECLEDWYIKPV